MTHRPSHRHRRTPRAMTTLLAAPAVVVALTLASVVPAHAAPAPEYLLDPSDPPGTYSVQNLAADRTSANFFYRIPALAHLGDGVVVAAWDARPGSAADAPNPNSIMQRRSTDNGATWGPATIIAAGRLGDANGAKYGYSDPSYVHDRETGRLFAFFVYSKDQGFHGSAYGNDEADRQVISSAVIHSDDGGVTWSEPRLITDVTKPANGTVTGGVYTPVAGDVRANFATSGEGIQLRYGAYAGRLIQQFAGTVRQANGSVAIQAYSVYSDDHGATWHKGENVGTGMDENKVVELSDGRVLLNSRDSDNGRYRKVAMSTDGGATYGAVTQDLELPDPTNNASIVRLHPDAAEGTADARKLLFTNSNNGANGNRVNGAVRVSCDDGQTWPGLRGIDTGSFAYSSATVLDDGRIGVLWERNYTSDMPFSSFDEAWINYVCAPLSVPEQALAPGVESVVPVTVTNQEQTALSGAVTFHTPSGWTADTVAVEGIAPGASTTVDVRVTAPAGAAGTQRLQAAFTVTDGRLSQFTSTLRLPAATNLGLTLTSASTSPTRDVVANPYVEGDVLSFSLRVTSTAGVATLVTPKEANFTTGFLPTACRWQNLAPLGAYNCTTPKRTLTADDIARGWFTPEFSFTVAPMSDTAAAVTVTHTGAPVALRDGVLGATITGARADASRDLAADPYAVGEQVPYSFRVDSTSPVTSTVAPTSGRFAPFVPPGAGNCRFTGLAAFAGYDCATPRHTVTQADLDRGYFDATSSWTVTAVGQTTASVTVEAPEVDVIARDPRIGGATVGTWQDVNGDGVATVGDTVTWTTRVENTGNVRLDAVTAGDLERTSLAPGESEVAETSTVVLASADIATGEVAAPVIAATASNGARAVGADIAGPAMVLAVPGAWSAGVTYLAGERVQYAGTQWVASWWTRAQTPGDPSGPWQEFATDESGATLWTPSRIYTAGEVVEHDGESFVAKWWTRNQRPGQAWGPWQAVTED
ncbi:exo-alpha-sialidase [Microbacterium sp. NPDC056569]|uniref:exo-alpha-sialidase n=1 Tax=Microbacterium sp. NPDC056569 TaxID=3345867 RepID=UPI0036712D7D